MKRKTNLVKVGDKLYRFIILNKYMIYNNDKKHNETYVDCICDCGKIIYKKQLSGILSGNSKSCGCLLSESSCIRIKKNMTTHGQSKTRLYRIWQDIRRRCNDTNRQYYKNYGGRGIKVCEEWDSFVNFRNWALNNGYQDNLEIDRKDTNGNYEPKNCKWSTDVEQSNNKRNNIYITIFGETKTIALWSKDERCKVTYRCLYKRLHKGMNPEKALTMENQR